jgi:hypothetical protein
MNESDEREDMEDQASVDENVSIAQPMNDVYSPSFESKMDPKFQLDDASRKVYDP